MLKRTIYVGSAAELKTRHEQLVITNSETGEVNQVPIEDMAVILFDHRDLTYSHSLMQKLLEQNVAVIYCDAKYHPAGMLLPLDGHHLQSERFRHQIEASLPLKKQLWGQTVKAKVRNQARLLELLGQNPEPLLRLQRLVKSGDPDNLEARAARFYWPIIFKQSPGFIRDRFGMPPNPLLNYGYAILRAAVARALSGSGLLPTLGIHHRNKYNAYCLADDIMEPYRPFVDKAVAEILSDTPDHHVITKNLKARFLRILTADVRMDGEKSPLLVALSQTTASLAECYLGHTKEIKYPLLCG
jgi:CRISP-associated protein Cas1